MVIEPTRPEDLEEIYELTNELEGEILPRDSFAKIYGKILESEKEYIFAAREGKVVGYVHGRLTEELHHGGIVSTVQELIVEKEYRRKHAGSRLLEAAVRLSKERGALSIELTSHFLRKGAHRFYETMGFEKTSYKFVMELSDSGSLDEPQEKAGSAS